MVQLFLCLLLICKPKNKKLKLLTKPSQWSQMITVFRENSGFLGSRKINYTCNSRKLKSRICCLFIFTLTQHHINIEKNQPFLLVYIGMIQFEWFGSWRKWQILAYLWGSPLLCCHLKYDEYKTPWHIPKHLFQNIYRFCLDQNQSVKLFFINRVQSLHFLKCHQYLGHCDVHTRVTVIF